MVICKSVFTHESYDNLFKNALFIYVIFNTLGLHI